MSEGKTIPENVRPLNLSESNRKDTNAVTFSGDKTINLIPPGSSSLRTFTFDMVFGPDHRQSLVFEQSGVQNLVAMAIDGYTSMAIAFGQTGSGKTHTMTGPPAEQTNQFDSEEQGIVQRSCKYLFDKLSQRSDNRATVKVSYLEIYNEQVIDLLNPQQWRNLLIRWSKRKGFYVENLFHVQCQDTEEVLSLLEEGQKKRHIGCPSLNEWSSRSHSILTLSIHEEVLTETNPEIYITKKGKLVFADLAGSEKFRDGCVADDTLIESNNINKSLLVLGKCISALSDPKKRNGHIPYRDSKLTKLLSEGLRGNSVTLLLACITPSSYNFSESLNTLRYASGAKRIRTKPVFIYDPREKLIFSMKKELEVLRNENKYLRNKLDFPSKEKTEFNTENKFKMVENSKTTSAAAAARNENGSLSLNPEERSLYEMLQEYMIENETLRSENRDLQEGRQQMARELKQVYKENEKLYIQMEKQHLQKSSTNWRQQITMPNPWQPLPHQQWMDSIIIPGPPAQFQRPTRMRTPENLQKTNPNPQPNLNLPILPLPSRKNTFNQKSWKIENKTLPRMFFGASKSTDLKMINPADSVEIFNERLRAELAAIDGEIRCEEEMSHRINGE